MQWSISECSSWGCFPPCSQRSERHIFINGSEAMSNLPWFHRRKNRQPLFKPMQCDLTAYMTHFLPLPPFLQKVLEYMSVTSLFPAFFINPSFHILQIHSDTNPLLKIIQCLLYSSRIKFKVPNTAFSLNCQVSIYLLSFIFWHSLLFNFIKIFILWFFIHPCNKHLWNTYHLWQLCLNKFTEARWYVPSLMVLCSLYWNSK